MARPAKYKNSRNETVPSVTTVIKNIGGNNEGLIRWAWQLGVDGIDLDDARRKAMSIGTVSHARIEAHLRGEQIDIRGIPPELIEPSNVALEAWLNWSEMMRFEPRAIETSLVSEEYGYGGTFDLCAISGKRTVFDWKVSSGIYPENLIQLSAYAMLWNEHHTGDDLPYPPFDDQRVEQVAIVRLGKDEPTVDVCIRPESVWRDAFEAFKLALQLHRIVPRIKRSV